MLERRFESNNFRFLLNLVVVVAVNSFRSLQQPMLARPSPSLILLPSRQRVPLTRRFNLSSKMADDTGSIVRALLTSDVAACANHAAQGGMVAFPTETVYGLGCNALDNAAIQSVFDAKERPLTDPLIVHVLEASEAFALWDADPDSPTGRILTALTSEFWPGPLTLVARANPSGVVPPNIMAGTGFCACRSPRHSLARELLAAAKIPMAAPSANKFGHVSPTTAQHVWDDLKDEQVWILQQDENLSASSSGLSCDVGVESSVAKLERRSEKDETSSDFILTVLRQGAVSSIDLSDCLQRAGLEDTLVSVRSNVHRATADHVATVAPGQTVKHYSPHVPSFLVSAKYNHVSKNEENNDMLGNVVVLDFGGTLSSFEKTALAYRDLSAARDSSEAAQVLFDSLRWAELVPKAKIILFPELVDFPDALTLALKDRLTRAASGVVIDRLQDAFISNAHE